MYVIVTEPPAGSPDTENVTVPVGGSVGGQGPLYGVFVMLALAETVTGRSTSKTARRSRPAYSAPRSAANPVG